MSPLLVAALFVLASFPKARADFIYQFTTTPPVGIGGSLSVTITASDAAVTTGSLSSSDITSLDMALTGTSAPFVDGMTTSLSALSNPFAVDPSTGAFSANTPELFATFPPETVDLMASAPNTAIYKVTTPDVVQNGQGIWSVTHTATVPEPSSAVLAVVGGCVASAVAVRRRGRRRSGSAATTPA
jgi:hypothetical protein